MSLQLQLIHQYIELKASASELQDILEKCKTALTVQRNRQEIESEKLWDDIYQKWFDEYLFDGKLPITRHLWGGSLYYRVGRFLLIVKTNYIEIQIADTDARKCRVCIEFDGIHEGCERDGCHDFDALTTNQEMIKYLLSFKSEVHDVIVQKAKQLTLNRLE